MTTIISNNLSDLEQKMISLSEMVVTAIEKSVKALKEKDTELAKRVKKGDKKINKLRWDIEENCISMIATQQPVASDLRQIIALLSIITELERMGDYAVGIAKININIGDEAHVKPLIDIPRMSEIACDMIEQSIKAFVNRDESLAKTIHKKDDELDELYDQVNRELISFMLEKPGNITQCTYLQWASHCLERVGDRVTNICERVIFLVSGGMIEDVD